MDPPYIWFPITLHNSVQYLRPHALHAELALFRGGTLAPLLAGYVRDIGMLDLRRVDRSAQIVADDKARPVTVREDDDAARFGQAAQQCQALAVVEDAEAGRLENGRVHDLRERVFAP